MKRDVFCINLIRMISVTIILIILASCQTRTNENVQPPLSTSDLKFSRLAESWDEAIPLGNGMLGALIWKKEGKLRFSLDRADLWDLRPMENIDKPEWSFSWVKEQWEKNTYSKVQEMFDLPYKRNPGPSKIPGGALEFDISSLGEVETVGLNLKNALCLIKWKSGVTLQVFINAEGLVGWFRFEGLKTGLTPDLVAPSYNFIDELGGNLPLSRENLKRLGYPKGELNKTENSITYNQKGWGGFQYQVNVRWKERRNGIEGCWSINSEFPGWDKQVKAEELTTAAIKDGFSSQYSNHQKWWGNFWSQSDISIPDTMLNKQWHLEMYKLGAATGNGAPPISLQAVWTADNGGLPPWKGDFHNDLNTQMSYWPTYSSNHLIQERGFIDWLEKNRSEFEKYTRQYFKVSGLNAPGVATLSGQPMGGWNQYSHGPTVSAWFSHHFYLHWRYTMDRVFLEKEAYPWIKEVAVYLDEISVTDNNGLKKLPLSSSPEIFGNSREAWFADMTNFDVGLVRWTFEKAAELANELHKTDEAEKWKNILSLWPQYDINPESGFTFAKGKPYNQSHPHFSHLIAFHPLGLVDWSNGEKDQQIIKSSIAALDKFGNDRWNGFAYSWLGNVKARAFDGKGAAEALRIFATCFCLKNSFNANGDQSGTGKSKNTKRQFTLEANFAFAAGIQEMLIQSHTGVIRLFPAIPREWTELSFNKLRTEGAFLISARIGKGDVIKVNILSEKGAELKILNPFKNSSFKCSLPYKLIDNIIVIETIPGQNISITR